MVLAPSTCRATRRNSDDLAQDPVDDKLYNHLCKNILILRPTDLRPVHTPQSYSTLSYAGQFVCDLPDIG